MMLRVMKKINSALLWILICEMVVGLGAFLAVGLGMIGGN